MSISNIVSGMSRVKSKWRKAWMAREGYIRIPLTTEYYPVRQSRFDEIEPASNYIPDMVGLVPAKPIISVEIDDTPDELRDSSIFDFDNRSLLDDLSVVAETGIFPPVSRFEMSKEWVDFFLNICKRPCVELMSQFADRAEIECQVWKLIHDMAYDATARENYKLLLPRKSSGEGWMGMSEYSQELTGLDRMLFEDCYGGSGNIQRQGMNVPQTSKIHRQEWLVGRFGSELDGFLDLDVTDSDVLVECFKTLEFTPEMVRIWIARMKDDPEHADEYIEQLKDLAFEMAKIEQPSVEWQVNPDNGFNWELDQKSQRYWNGVSLKTTWNGIIIDLSENPYDFMNDEEEYLELEFENPDGRDGRASDVFRYQNFGDDIGHRDSWIARQPKRFRKLIKAVKSCRSIDKLSKIGSMVHDGKIKLTSEQAVVFWGRKGDRDGAYWSRKRALISLEKSRMGAFAEKAIERLDEIESISQLRFAAVKLYEVRDGKLRVASPPTPYGWKQIWNAYWRRIKELTPQVEL